MKHCLPNQNKRSHCPIILLNYKLLMKIWEVRKEFQEKEFFCYLSEYSPACVSLLVFKLVLFTCFIPYSFRTSHVRLLETQKDSGMLMDENPWTGRIKMDLEIFSRQPVRPFRAPTCRKTKACSSEPTGYLATVGTVPKNPFRNSEFRNAGVRFSHTVLPASARFSAQHK